MITLWEKMLLREQAQLRIYKRKAKNQLRLDNASNGKINGDNDSIQTNENYVQLLNSKTQKLLMYELPIARQISLVSISSQQTTKNKGLKTQTSLSDSG